MRRSESVDSHIGQLFWALGLLGLVVIIGIGIAAWRWIPASTQWRTHESARGGFKVDLPAEAMTDIAKQTGFPATQGTTIEGTVHRKVDYVVVWGNAPTQRNRVATDEQTIDGAIQGIQNALPANASIERGEMSTVNGCPSRDVTVIVPGAGEMVIRFVVADSRLYMVVAGGRGGKADHPDVRRVIDSFEITDPKLLAAAKDRADAQERDRKADEEQRELLRKVQERASAEERLREEQRLRQEVLARLARSGELVGAVAFSEVDQILVHVNKLDRIREAAALVTQMSVGKEVDYLRDLPVFAGQSGAIIAQQLLVVASAESEAGIFRGKNEAFLRGVYTGLKPADPADFTGLLLHMGFDDAQGKELIYAPGGKTVSMPADAKLGPGVRGTALYLTGQKPLDLRDIARLEVTDNKPITIALWFKARADKAELCRFTSTGVGPVTGYSIGFDKQVLFSRPWDRLQEALPVRYVRDNSSAEFTADGKWHHAALVHEIVPRNPGHFERYDLYLDGVRIARHEVIRGFGEVKVQPTSLGGTVESSKQIPDTEAVLAIDDLCVFDRALREIDIRALAGLGGFAIAPSPRPGPTIELTTLKPTRPNSFAAFDMEKKTLWVIENDVKPVPIGKPKPKDSGPVYLLRYELPTNTLVGKYELPTRGYNGILNTKTNQLYLAVAADDNYGELHLFDLAEQKPNDGTNAPKLKPTGVFSTKTHFCDFAISPDGKFIYALGHTNAKLWAYRFNPDLQVTKEAQLPDSTLPGRFILDADGKNLVLSAGRWGQFPPLNGKRIELDPVKWEVASAKPLAWGGSEWVEAGGKIYATAGNAPPGRVFELYDAETSTKQNIYHLANHVCKTPDGKYVFMSGLRGAFAGFAVFSTMRPLQDGRPVPLNEVRDQKFAELYGPMTISPDGKWISFTSGALVRITRTPGEGATEDEVKNHPGKADQK
jgi:hypothetical protein